MDWRFVWFSVTEVCTLHCSQQWWDEGMEILKTQGADAWRTWMYGA